MNTDPINRTPATTTLHQEGTDSTVITPDEATTSLTAAITRSVARNRQAQDAMIATSILVELRSAGVDGLGVAALANRLGQRKPTVDRLLSVFSDAGQIERGPRGRSWLSVKKDGTVPLAMTPDGHEIPVALFDAGVEHALIVGGANTGKSNTLATQLLPGVIAGLDVVFYIDGGHGMSATHLAGACDWWAVDGPQEWSQVIEAAHAVMRARAARRTAPRVPAWRGRMETDPILTVAIDESAAVKSMLPQHVQDLVLDILREGRKVGVRVIQVAHDATGEDLIGGRRGRELVTGNGVVIGHRAGEVTANLLAESGDDSIDLRRLPMEPGWCGIIRRGHVLTWAARVKRAAPDKISAALALTPVRALTGEDLAAAGPAYTSRVKGRTDWHLMWARLREVPAGFGPV